jgi:hypothetical protein
VLDNCERPLKSDALCTALTEVVIRDRILGSTRTISVPTTTTWIATGNALAIDGDLSSRTLLCTLDPQCERPEERDFSVDLHAYVPHRRGELAAAALTLVKAFLAADAPRQKIPTFGRFEAWSRFAREPLVWLGCADPCESRRAIEARDPVRERLGNLLEAWHAVFGDREQTIAAAIQETESEYMVAAMARGDGSADALHALRNALEAVGEDRGRLDGRRLGAFLAKHAGRIERGFRADQVGARRGVALWSVCCLFHTDASVARGLGGLGGFVPTHAEKVSEPFPKNRGDSFYSRAGTDPPNPPNQAPRAPRPPAAARTCTTDAWIRGLGHDRRTAPGLLEARARLAAIGQAPAGRHKTTTAAADPACPMFGTDKDDDAGGQERTETMGVMTDKILDGVAMGRWSEPDDVAVEKTLTDLEGL